MNSKKLIDTAFTDILNGGFSNHSINFLLNCHVSQVLFASLYLEPDNYSNLIQGLSTLADYYNEKAPDFDYVDMEQGDGYMINSAKDDQETADKFLYLSQLLLAIKPQLN